jgi:hypothetical protein
MELALVNVDLKASVAEFRDNRSDLGYMFFFCVTKDEGVIDVC